MVLSSVFLLLFVSDLFSAVSAKDAIKVLEKVSKAERHNTLVNEARKEGQVVWVSSTPADSVAPVIAGFKRKYPQIQLQYVFVSGRVLADRITREYKAGKRDIDILGSSAVTFSGLKQAGVIESYASPETDGILPSMKDPEGYWISHYTNVLAIVCNRNIVKSAPTDWREFTNPKWKNNFSIDTERFQWFMALSNIYTEQGAKKLISDYLQNGAQVRRGGQLQIQLVAAGEYGCALAVYINNLLHVLKQGAPLSYSVPEPVMLNPAIIMLTKYPVHPFSAMLLYDYIISEEGLSEITKQIPLLPPRDGLPVTDEIRPLQKKRSYFISVEEQSRNFTQIRDTYNSLLKR